jgi:hypothetical protein
MVANFGLGFSFSFLSKNEDQWHSFENAISFSLAMALALFELLLSIARFHPHSITIVVNWCLKPQLFCFYKI